LALPEAQDVFDRFVVGNGLFDDLDLDGGHELGDELAGFEVAPVVVGAVALGMIGIFAATALFSTDVVLPRQAARAHVSEGQELSFDLLDFSFRGLNMLLGVHVR